MALNRIARFNGLILTLASLLPLVISIRNLNPAPPATREPQFKEGDLIPLFANTLYSHHLSSRCKQIPYFDLPFCSPGDPIPGRKKSLEEILAGDCFTRTQYEMRFKVESVGKILCEKNLTREQVAKFRIALFRNYEYQMSYNNILFEGILGEIRPPLLLHMRSTPRHYLVKHMDFYPYYFQNQVKDIKVKSRLNSAVDITPDSEIRLNFTYSVFWKQFETQLTNETSDGWISMVSGWIRMVSSVIFWSCLCIVWIGLLLAAVVPYLMNYFSRYFPKEASDTPRQIHGDECRRPPYSSLLGAILGNGVQLLTMILLFFYLLYYGVLSTCYDEIAELLALYCFTSFVSGYWATSFHSQYTEHGWKECVFQTGVLYFVPVFITVLIVNVGEQIEFEFTDLSEFISTTLKVLVLVTLPLILGGSLGYPFENQPRELCMATRSSQRTLWKSRLMSTPAQMFLGGLLPFMIIFRQMDEFYASLLTAKVCGALSTVFLNFILLTVMTIFVGAGFTFYQLLNEDINWWWRSVLRGGSTAIFMFGYGIYFETRVRQRQSIGNVVIFTGYNACFCYALFLVLGSIGYYASSCVFYALNAGLHKRE